MKKITLFLLLYFSQSAFGQWIEKDSTGIIEEFIEITDWIYVNEDGSEISCALPFNSSSYKTTYYKKEDSTNVVLCKCVDLNTNNYIITFFRLITDDKNRKCWQHDLFWMDFNDKNELLKIIFFDSDGNIIEPQKFTLSVK